MTAEDHWENGKAAFHAKDFGKALDDFNQAINLDPTVSRYFESRAMVLTENQEWLLAIEDLTKALDEKLSVAHLHLKYLHRDFFVLV